MSFESPREESANHEGAERILVTPHTIAELGGHIHERLAPLFTDAQLSSFQDMMENRGVTLSNMGGLTESDVIQIAMLASNLFELGSSEREIRADEISNFIKERS